MSFRDIKISNRSAYVHKAIVKPVFGSKTVLVGNTWDYVTMWLKRKKNKEALHYWDQARHFADATKVLPKTSAPLTAYYCFLNASKALLAIKKVEIKHCHGVSGESKKGKRALLANEIVTFKKDGVLSSLCRLFGESANNDKYTLKAILYNLPYIHRAFCKTFSSSSELFIPITEPRFVVKDGSKEAWFCTNIRDSTFQTQHTINKLPADYERDIGIADSFVIRLKKPFEWEKGPGSKKNSLRNLLEYHMLVRQNVLYIHGSTRLWYLKRYLDHHDVIPRSSLTLTFAAMHRLSELARYSPLLLARHFDCQHNWLLSEFLETAQDQFLDEISSEITGENFMIPGIRKTN